MTADFPDWSNPVIPGRFVLTGSGHTAIAATGTAVPLRATTPIKQVAIRADRENAATIYLGVAGVTADNVALTGGHHLYPGDAIVFPESNLANIFVNGTLGDGVSYTWWA